MKICILTQPLRTNYGGLLQAYALQTVFKRMGHEVVVDRYGAKEPTMSFGKRSIYFTYHILQRFVLRNKRYNPFNYLFTSFKRPDQFNRKRVAVHTDRFIDNHIDTIDFFQGRPTPSKEVLDQFDALVVGSDQTWRPCYSYIPAYFLDFTSDKPVKRIAYAASFGVDNWTLSPATTKLCAKLAKQFDAISVREDSGVALCRTYLGVDAVHLLDPTLLLEKEDYLQLMETEEKTGIGEKRMMCYILDRSPEKHDIIRRVSTELGLTPFEIMPDEEETTTGEGALTGVYPAVSEWINGFCKAEFVVTDSFHGTVFALIFNKPFVVMLNPQRGASRFTSLLRIFHLENRVLSSSEELTGDHLQPVDYASVNQIRREWQDKSFSFLKRNLS